MPTSNDGRSLLVDGLVGLGMVVSIVLVGVSATLNFRMGLHSGEGGVDGVAYGVGAASGDLLKAMSPFMGHWGLKGKDWLAVAVAFFLYAVLTAYSFTAVFGFSSIHRADLSAAAVKRIEDHSGAKGALDRAEARLKALGPQRTPAEVQAAIDGLYLQAAGKTTLGAATEHCTIVRAWSRPMCIQIKALEGEKDAAAEAESLAAKVEQLRGELKGGAAAPATNDAQLEGIKGLLELVHLKVSKETVGYGLGLLLAGLIELGSGLGLYLVSTPLRMAKPLPARAVSIEGSSSPAATEALRGEVADYVTANVMLMEGGGAGMDALFTDYVRWCRGLNRYAVARASFERAFQRFAQLAGVELAELEGEPVFLGIAIVRE